MEREPYVIAELEDLSPVFAPLKTTTRVKYTCFNVSANLLVVGASSGGLYLFRREPCVFLQLIPSKDGAVSQVAVSPDERLLGVATVKGTVNIVERSQRGARVVASSFEHTGTIVTALLWAGNELYAGDAEGRVSVLAKTVFQPPAALLMQLDSKIVQLDASSGLLLASTLTRCYICDTERECFRQVGQKLRDGAFGACFLSEDVNHDSTDSQPTERARTIFSDGDKAPPDYSHLSHLKAYCSRPGTRIWEVDLEGTVLRTHHFKEALASPPRPITTEHIVDNNNKIASKHPEQPVNFGRVFVILTKYLLTYTSDAIFVLDPEKSDIVLWCNQISDIIDIRVTSNVIYLWCSTGKIHALNLVPLEKFLIRMYFWKKFAIVADLCLEHADYLKDLAPNSSKLHLLKDLDVKLKEQEEASSDVLNGLSSLLEILKTQSVNTQIQNAQKLKSGIYQIARPTYLNLKNRSHSVSPDRMEYSKHGSSSSLPDLVKEEESESKMADSKEVVAVAEMCRQEDFRDDEIVVFLKKLFLLCSEGSDSQFPNPVRPIPLVSMFSTDQLAKISKVFRQSMTTKCLLDFLDGIQCQGTELVHPEYLKKTIQESYLKLDWKMSQMLKIFSNVIDESTILSDLKLVLPQCYYLSLLEVVGKFEAAAMNLHESLTPPKALSVVTFLLKVGQVDQIARWGHKLDLRDVMYLTMSQEKGDGRAARVAFLSVADNWKSGPSAWKPLEPYLLHCLALLEETQICSCGFPVPAAKRTASPRFIGLGTALLAMKGDDPKAAIGICGAVPWLWPQLLHQRNTDDLLTLLPLILHLGDLEILEKRLSELNPLVCEILVRHMAGLLRGECLNCGHKFIPMPTPGVTWTQIALLLIKAVGHSQTISLLTKYQTHIDSLDPVFHKAAILSAIMEKHSSGLRHGVVDLLAGRNQQTPLLSPYLQAEIFSSPPANPDQPSDSHWGLRLESRASCDACALPLSARVLQDGGIVFFRCRHAFHSVCLRTTEKCPNCC